MDSLIPIMNKLQDVLVTLGQANLLDLPQIVVIGEQSSGKSSLLESLLGRDILPRGTGMVTRRPLILQLIKREVEQEYGEFLHIPNVHFTNFEDIKVEIEQNTQDEIGNRGVSPHPINLKIYSPNVLNLTLVDLPGIIQNAIGGLPANTADLIREMVLQYISNPNAIILAVSCGNADLANSVALQMARMVDPEGTRTLGVITKIDIMDQGTDALALLDGTMLPLKLGYVGVKGRSQADINNLKTVAQGLIDEENFFKNSPIYNRMAHRMGTRFLAKRLNALLLDHISKVLPKLKRTVQDMIQKVRDELGNYGDMLQGNPRIQGKIILDVIQNFVRQYQQNLDGELYVEDTEKDQLKGGCRIYYERISYIHEIKSLDALDHLSDQQIRTTMENAGGCRNTLFIPEHAFDLLIKQQISRFSRSSTYCLQAIFHEITQIVNSIDLPEFTRFHNLKTAVQSCVADLLSELKRESQIVIDQLLEIERAYINVKHPEFIGADNAYKETEAEMIRANEDLPAIPKELSPKAGLFARMIPWGNPQPEIRPQVQNNIQLETPPARLQLTHEPTEAEVFKVGVIKKLIHSYYEIVKKAIADAVPKAIITFLVNKSKDDMQMRLTEQLFVDKNYDYLLEEAVDIVQRRKDCDMLLQQLSIANGVLNEVREFKLVDN